MNTNSGNDPMLCSFIGGDDWINKLMATTSASASPSPTPSIAIPQSSVNAFTISVEGLLSPEPNSSLSDFTTMWPSERKRVMSIKMEEEDAFSASPYSATGEGDNGDIDMEDIDIGSNTTVTEIKTEIEDPDYDDMPDSVESQEFECKPNLNFLHSMTEAEARRLVEERFEQIAFVPNPNLNQREKISFILAKSDCADFTVDNILNFDKRSGDSARACAKIVQNIPQRYRWECVKPEDIPCCYTIVADCKKVSSRDKPPRPMNAFMIWAQGARRLINELCPKMQNALISEALGYYWRQKSDAFKKKFEQEKIKLRRFHNVEFPEYKYKPKTKVQKAKEKQELSLSKAKMRATVKREKIRQAEESNLYRRRTTTKCGRPRKTKSTQDKKEVDKSPSPYSVVSEAPMKMSPTKPAIKDMLTLKILNDRRSKGVTNSVPKSHETVHTAFGQLSPLEVDSPGMGDIFDELGNLDTSVASHCHQEKDISGKSMPSSVYDTPANTPPVNVDEELRLSPIQQQQQQHHHHHSQQPAHSSSSSVSLTATVADPVLSKPCTSPTNTTPKQQLMPSLSAMLSSPSRTVPCVRSAQGLTVVGFAPKTVTLSNARQLPAVPTSQTSELADLLLTYFTDVMSPVPTKSNSQRAKDASNGNISVIDANNNTSDVNNNSSSDDNNNSIGLPPSYAASIMNSKYGPSFASFNDLDTVNLDYTVPFLSDDDMNSLLNSL